MNTEEEHAVVLKCLVCLIFVDFLLDENRRAENLKDPNLDARKFPIYGIRIHTYTCAYQFLDGANEPVHLQLHVILQLDYRVHP